MSMENKNLENAALDDDVLDQVTGGKKKVETLLYKKTTSEVAAKTIYKGEAKKADNLLYKDDDRIKLDGPRYC
ncbi:MAG: hypothetical protein II842_01760 [Butyrivibrio sp.]|nr:hypothetical protein [Butyrivibrio sp.]